MVLNTQQLILLQSYRDRAYVSNCLCEEASNWYGKLRSIINIPILFSNSVMIIFNSSSFSTDDMKIPNIVLNSLTSLLLSIMGNFKLVEKQTNFKSIGLKFNKLCHSIENNLTNDIDNISIDQINNFITEYDNLNESLDFAFPDFIKTKISKRYYGKKALPNILNCETDFTTTASIV